MILLLSKLKEAGYSSIEDAQAAIGVYDLPGLFRVFGLEPSDQVKPAELVSDQVKPAELVSDQVKPAELVSDQVKPAELVSDQVKPVRGKDGKFEKKKK